MARPARVRMRRRKPCFLARRRLFGWNVRFDMMLLSIEYAAYTPEQTEKSQAPIRGNLLKLRLSGPNVKLKAPKSSDYLGVCSLGLLVTRRLLKIFVVFICAALTLSLACCELSTR